MSEGVYAPHLAVKGIRFIDNFVGFAATSAMGGEPELFGSLHADPSWQIEAYTFRLRLNKKRNDIVSEA